jgi:ferredoxin
VFVEQVKDIGVIGPRLLSLAVASGLSGLVVYCPDGSCLGKSKAKQAVESIKSVLRADLGFQLAFVEGVEGRNRIRSIYENIPSAEELEPQKDGFAFGRESWRNYTSALRSIALPEAPTSGLGLTNVVVSDGCTLCGTCEKYCPHSALKASSGKLEFDSSRCTGCGYCASLCPENSIRLEPLQKIENLECRIAYEDEILNCARCGRPIDSVKFLRRVALLVGSDDTMMKYCNLCKQQIAFQKLMQSTPKK